MDRIEVVNIFFTILFLGLFLFEIKTILKLALDKVSFEAIEYLNFEELQPPTITICPVPAYKGDGPFLNNITLKENSYAWEEIFHPQTLERLNNSTFSKIKQSFTGYYGRCFTIQKLSAEKVADYSFQIVLNNSLGNPNQYQLFVYIPSSNASFHRLQLLAP